jgi:hypothetical protein
MTAKNRNVPAKEQEQQAAGQWLSLLKTCQPYIIAIALFVLLATVFFAAEVFDGKELPQGDVKSVGGWGKDLADYTKATGEYAHWSNRMFGGMPANYTMAPPMVNVFNYLGSFTRLLPSGDMVFLFLYLLGFYIFLLSLGCKQWLSVFGAIAYCFATYNLIIIEAGHLNKALAMSTMAPVIGGVILCYRKRFISGVIITLVALGINITYSHQQISYYLLIMIVVIALVYLYFAFREKTLKDYVRSSAVLAVVALLAIAPEAGKLLYTADYTKETMRGGAVLQTKVDGEKASSGLDIDYAYMWSYGQGETFTLLIPNLYGASSHYNIGQASELYRVLRPTGQAAAWCRHAPMYWGGDRGKSMTSGPVYVGAFICCLFIFGLFVVKGREKWWLLWTTVLSVMLAWGRHFPAFNDFLFYHLPLYNKFRTPEMALVIAEVSMVTLAVLSLKSLIETKDRQQMLKPLYISAGITGGLCLLLALFGSSLMSFTSELDAATIPNYPGLMDAIVADRKSMLTSDAWRSFFFIAASALAVLYFIRKSTFKPVYLLAFLSVLLLTDLWTVDKRFINSDSFEPKQKKANEILPTEVDKQILQDTDPDYRVMNLTVSTFNESNTAYFHKSVGGYSPAKLRRYQDIIDFYLSGQPNLNVLNMLNTRYIIVPSEKGQPVVQFNPEALGNAWFVNNIKWFDTPDAEIAAIKDFNPAQTALVDKEWQDELPEWETLQGVDSLAAIKLTDYANPGYLIYESSSNKAQLAVFSEVFYKTWKAYIDGVEAKPVRVNYILRGLAVPAGRHKIEFKCLDPLYVKGARISLIASCIIGVLIVLLLGYAVWNSLKNHRPDAALS